MIALLHPLRTVLRRELLFLCAVVCAADIVLGLATPLFPLLANQLGASLLLIGTLTALSSATQVVSGLPLGLLADRWGSGLVIALGIGMLAAGTGLLSIATSPLLLVLCEVLLGAGTVATFGIGAALAGELSPPRQRGMVMGIYTTAMGLGFTIGPLFGGLAANLGGPRGSLQLAAAVALLGLLGALYGLPKTPIAPAAAKPGTPPGPPVHEVLLHSRALQIACVANLLFSPMFTAIVSVFVPLRGEALGFSILAISSLFVFRALASTSTRLPIGMLSTPIWSKRIIVLSLLLAGLAAIGLSQAQSYGMFMAALILEGISYGMFITAGQAFVSQRIAHQHLGAAMGAYSTAGGLSSALSPFLLGAVAAQLGMPTVFWCVGALLLLGAAMVALLLGYAKPLEIYETAYVEVSG